MVDYNNFAKTFAKSRKKMKWQEIDYFIQNYLLKEKNNLSILDIGCGTGRFLEQLSYSLDINKIKYFGIDLSSGLIEEAKKSFPDKKFLELNMLDIDKILLNSIKKDKLFNNIFFIASFHHLDNIKNRKKVLEKTYKLLEKGGKIYMTNWALNSQINEEKYKNSQIKNSKNNFGSIDYNIKIGKFNRYYHCFDLSELEFLAKNSGFKILENRIFENNKNYITILEK